MGRDRERIGGSEDTHQLWGKEVRIKGCERERRRGDTPSLPVSHHHTLGMLTARGGPPHLGTTVLSPGEKALYLLARSETCPCPGEGPEGPHHMLSHQGLFLTKVSALECRMEQAAGRGGFLLLGVFIWGLSPEDLAVGVFS